MTPPHLKTPAAYVQALEIAHELRQRSSNRLLVPDAMVGIAYALTAAVARGKVVRSMAVVALPLVRKTTVGDLTWAFGIPTTLSSEAYHEAFGLAFEAATAFKRHDFPATSDYLLSTLEVESLSAKIGRYGRATVVQGINAALSDPLARPKEGTVVVRWGWFDQCIKNAHRVGGAGARIGHPQGPAGGDH